MAQKNVTITLPEETVRKAKHLAVDRGISLSRFIAELLEAKVGEQRTEPTPEYLAARDRELARMKEGLPLGLSRGITWTRESLHER
jgi:hypothetical protein